MGNGGGMRRVVVVTGAASGIGAAICRRLAAPGTGLVAHTRTNRVGLAAVAEAVAAAGAEVETVSGDLAEATTAVEVIGLAVARFGRVHVLVSNAGYADRTPAAGLGDAAFTRSLEAMPGALLRLVRAAIPCLTAGGEGRIIAVSSFVAHVFRPDVPGFPASTVAKAGVEALVKALAVDLAPRATVNAVAPGFIRKDDGTHRIARSIPMRHTGRWRAFPWGVSACPRTWPPRSLGSPRRTRATSPVRCCT
jgi:NAD(P)-dependent dehydrogenase (short-subunit alcohol dehydrogenase family)